MPQKKLKIAFLDAATLDLGDLDMTPITGLGRYVALSSCSQGKIPQKVRDAQVVLTNKVVLTGKEMDQFPQLKLIGVTATGVNNIDLAAAGRRNIGVCNAAGYSTTTVVEHTLMFLLAFSHRLHNHHSAVLGGEWGRSSSFALLDYLFQDLAGKTLGIVGYGTIGRRVAKLAQVFDMKILIARLPGRKYSQYPKRVPLNTLLKKSDFVALHCTLTPRTQGLIDAKRLDLMKPSAYLLNLARGPIVVEEDVARALEKNWIAGYATDVMEMEPIKKRHPFLKKSLARKVLLTPHIAWASQESRQRLVNEVGKNITAFARGKKRNRLV